jgi:transcription elongation factor GreA
MSPEREILLTREGMKKLEEQLEHLKTERRPEVAEQIKQARAFGDISENAEYDEAKNDQAKIEGEIATIENTLRIAKIIEDDIVETGAATIGSSVKVENLNGNSVMQFHIVGSAEANPIEHKISNESPVGKALIGHKVGDVVNVNVPNGTVMCLRVLDISRRS